MDWASLQLWTEDEEKRIHACLIESLRQLIASQVVDLESGELKISGKLRPYLHDTKKKLKLAWTLHPEASSFEHEDAEKPYGHPDIRFSCNTSDNDQYDYDVECKLVRVKREGKSWDYCHHYIVDGVKRFQSGKYAQSLPPMGTMIGYVQEGEFSSLLELINDANRNDGFEDIQLQNTFLDMDVTYLTQRLHRHTDSFVVTHFWADLRR